MNAQFYIKGERHPEATIRRKIKTKTSAWTFEFLQERKNRKIFDFGKVSTRTPGILMGSIARAKGIKPERGRRRGLPISCVSWDQKNERVKRMRISWVAVLNRVSKAIAGPAKKAQRRAEEGIKIRKAETNTAKTRSVSGSSCQNRGSSNQENGLQRARGGVRA